MSEYENIQIKLRLFSFFDSPFFLFLYFQFTMYYDQMQFANSIALSCEMRCESINYGS